MAEPSTRTVERALALLATICERGGANLADSARDCDLAPSTALRLLRTLETTGFVSREEAGGTYRPGARLIQLGAQALSNESLIDLAKPTMEKLVAETGESAYLSVEGHGATALYIGIVEGTHSVRHTSWVGRTVPLDKSAAGRALRGESPRCRIRRGRAWRRGRRHGDRVPGVLGSANCRRDESGRSELPAHGIGSGAIRPDAGLSDGGRVRPA